MRKNGPDLVSPRRTSAFPQSRRTCRDEEALIEALAGEKQRGVVLDVYVGQFENEPDARLWDDPRVLITPHISSGTDRSRHAGIDLFCDNLRTYLAGRPLTNVID